MSNNLIISSSHVCEKDELMLEFLMTLVETQTGAVCKFVRESHGDIIIIDIDSKGGCKLFEKLSAEESSSYLIPLTKNAEKIDSELSLPKPLRSADVVNVAKAIINKKVSNIDNERLQKPNQGTAGLSSTDSNQPEPAEIKRPSFKKLFNFLVENGADHTTPVNITYGGISCIVDFKSRRYFSIHKPMLLSMLCKIDISKLEYQPTNEAEVKLIKEHNVSHPLSDLILISALLGSSGELVEALNHDSVLRLKRWPNLKPIADLPSHIISVTTSLSAFMTKNAATFAEIIKQTNHSQADVINFVNACHALGYLDNTETKTPVSSQTAKQDNQRSGLFAKLRARFGLNND